MKYINAKSLSVLVSTAILVGCGGGDKEEEFKFYTLKEAGAQQLELTVEASGTVEAISSIEIKSKASGQVLFLGAEVGDFVEEGVVLARIDQRTPTNTLAQANADLEVAKVRLSNAQNQFDRSKRLHDEGNISDKSFEDAQEAFSSARAQLVRAEVFLENARIALDDTSVRSPIAGTVISRLAEVGQVITSPTLLMEMADLNKVRVRALIDEIDIGKISIGQEVTLKVSAYRDKRFTGVVSKIEPMSKIDQNVTTFPVLIDIENKDNLLLIGMNTDVEIEILNEEVALALPAGSLRTRKDVVSVAGLLGIKESELKSFLSKKVPGENFDTFIVLKKTSKGALPFWVKVGKTDLNHVEVKGGITEKEIVYVLPSEGLIKYQQRFSERVKGRFG
jgi:HlyD family secretion protein